MSKNFFSILLFILLKVHISFGQQIYIPEQSDPLLESWRWRHFPEITKYGVQILSEDENGTVWFATGQGLVSYDGFTWREHSKPAGVSWGQLFDMDVYKNKVYLTRKDGLLCFDSQNNSWNELIDITVPSKVFRFVNQSLEVHSLTGDVYLSSTKGLIYYNGQQVYLYTTKNDKKEADSLFPSIKSIIFPQELMKRKEFNTRFCIESPKGEMYIFNTGFTKGGSILKATATGNEDNPLQFSINKDIKGDPNPGYKARGSFINHNEIWIGNRLTNKKISILKDNQWSLFSVCEMFGDRDIYSGIVQMNDGSIIVASEGQLYIQRKNEWKRYQFPDIPVTSTGHILILKTKDGNLWIGGENNDFHYVQYSNQRWSTYKNLFYQFTDHNNTQWFLSNDNKVVFQSENKWYSYNRNDGIIDAPTKLVMANKGIVWCMGSEKGIAAACYLNNNRWKKITFDSLSKSIEPRSIFIDKDSSIFFGGKVGAQIEGGIVHIKYNDIEKIKIKQITEGFPNSITGGIIRDKNGVLIVSTQKSKNKMSPQGEVQELKGISTGKASCMSSDADGNIWFGSEDEGLFIWDGEETKQVDINNGLISNVVTNMCIEPDQTAWVATEKDITRFDGQSWINEVFLGQFIIEKEAGDLKIDQQGALWINIVPRKWIMRGLYPDMDYDFSQGFYSVRYTADTVAPKCNFEFHTKIVDPIGNTHIKWNGIDYMNETPKEKLLFSYQLDDQAWTSFAPVRENTFLALGSGKHTLRLKAKDSYGNPGLSQEQITFSVQRPVYLRIWFLAMVSSFVLIISFLIRRIIKKNSVLLSNNIELKEQKEEIMAQNEEIQQQAEEISAQRDVLDEKNQKIQESFKQLVLISEFGQKLTASLSIDVINDMMYQYVSDIVEFQAFGIGLLDEANQVIIYPSFYENGEILPRFEKSLNDEKSLTSWCINHQKSFVIGDIEEEYMKYVPSLNISTTKQTAYSRIHIPLTVKDKRIGILVINSFKRNAYSDDDLISMQTVASYISIALDNAKAYEQVNQKSRAIQESISYSKSIQNAFMPTREQLDKYLNTFVLFKPKDIVSGDFYWFSPIEKDSDKPLKAFISVADCTGHGVPGALVSSIGNNLLDRYINFLGERNPAQILEMVNVGFQVALKQDETRNNDGMDMALVFLEEEVSTTEPDNNSKPAYRTGRPETRNPDGSPPAGRKGQARYKITFSGAKSPLVIYRTRTGELEYHKGSRKSIGGLRAKRSKQYYEKLEFFVETGDIIYLFTDGMIDQHSPNRERFTKEKLMELIKSNANLDLSDQGKKLEQELKLHQQKEKQTDDITIMGIQL